jgi:hypothetical protein
VTTGSSAADLSPHTGDVQGREPPVHRPRERVRPAAEQSRQQSRGCPRGVVDGAPALRVAGVDGHVHLPQGGLHLPVAREQAGLGHVREAAARDDVRALERCDGGSRPATLDTRAVCVQRRLGPPPELRAGGLDQPCSSSLS